MISDAQHLWTTCAALLRAQVSDLVWHTAFDGVRAVDYDGATLTLGVPNPLAKERIEGRYLGLVRDALIEAVTPFRRAAAVHGPFAPEIRHAVAEGTAFLRSEVEQAFAPELAAAPAGARRELLDALAASSSWAVWDALRSEAGDSPEQAQAVLVRMVRSLLTGSSEPG